MIIDGLSFPFLREKLQAFSSVFLWLLNMVLTYVSSISPRSLLVASFCLWRFEADAVLVTVWLVFHTYRVMSTLHGMSALPSALPTHVKLHVFSHFQCSKPGLFSFFGTFSSYFVVKVRAGM